MSGKIVQKAKTDEAMSSRRLTGVIIRPRQVPGGLYRQPPTQFITIDADGIHNLRATLPPAIWRHVVPDVEAEVDRLARRCMRIAPYEELKDICKISENHKTIFAPGVGVEILALVYALESVAGKGLDLVEQIAANWRRMDPDIRWLLGRQTTTQAGNPADAGAGWRAALYHILADNPAARDSREIFVSRESLLRA
jgi:hypothetical protein